MTDEFFQAIKHIWTDDIVEYKSEFYNIPKSIIIPKPVQKPCIPIYLGGFSPNTLNRIAKYDADDWLGVCAGPLEQLETVITTMRNHAASYLSGTSNKRDQRIPMTGSIDEIGMDIKRINEIGISHIMFGYNFSRIGEDIDRMISITKQLSRFAK